MKRLGLVLALAVLAPAQEGTEEATEGGLGALGGLGWEDAAKPVDFAKVDRTIRKLPELRAEKPLYGLFLFGIEGENRVWAVLDAADRGGKAYDVLHLDRDADGDLTEAGERIAATGGVFKIGDFREPGTDVVHTNFTITWTRESIRYSMKWAGGPVTMGCHGPSAGSCANFAPSPREAPIFVPGTERPFEFEHWMSGTLRRDQENFFRVFLGNRGDRPGAFTCVDDKFLAKDEFVLAELRYRDGAGKERRWLAKLTERC